MQSTPQRFVVREAGGRDRDMILLALISEVHRPAIDGLRMSREMYSQEAEAEAETEAAKWMRN